MSDANGASIQNRLSQNIQTVSEDPSAPLDVKAFEDAEMVLSRTLQGEERLPLIQALAGLLPTLQQDATPAINLLLRFLEDLSYTDVLNFGSESLPFVDGLAVGEHMTSYNRLMLTILSKATHKPVDAAHVASMLDTMLALVRLWLCTPDTGIASQASTLLLDLLKVDQSIQRVMDSPIQSGGQGLVWKRIFGDRNVYAMLFEACSGNVTGLELSKSQSTLAQARLMEWLPAVAAMDWNVVSKSHHVDVEEKRDVKEGLLEFAAVKMVDYKDDVLMHRCLIDFYSELLHSMKPSGGSQSNGNDSVALRYLITTGLHARTIALYLQLPGTPVDPVDSMLLYGPAANYIATYASSYPDHFLISQMPKQINDRLTRVLNMSPGKWAHAESPKNDLHLVASLPRKALLSGDWSSSPLALLPTKSTNPDVLNTLAVLFHGPERREIIYPRSKPASAPVEGQPEAAHARALYYHYLSHNPRFWNDITTHANTVALKDLALAAINVLTAVTTANWSFTPDVSLPANVATPEKGELAILSPPALEYTLPYLLKPAQSFANLVGGRGDTESAAYKIAVAKFDALRALHGRVKVLAERQPEEGYQEIVTTLGKRVAEGPMSKEGQVGGNVGTMEL